MITQAEHRNRIDIGPAMSQVSPVMYWYKARHFKNDEEARGAFRLAYQQGLDGMGTSIAGWMGLNDKQFEAWMKDESLPPL